GRGRARGGAQRHGPARGGGRGGGRLRGAGREPGGLFRNVDRQDFDRVLLPGEREKVARLRAHHRPGERGVEREAAGGRIRLVVADQAEGLFRALERDRHLDPEFDLVARRDRGELGRELARAPVAQVALDRRAGGLVPLGRGGKRGLERRD